MFFNDFFDERPSHFQPPQRRSTPHGFWDSEPSEDVFDFFHPSAYQRNPQGKREQQQREQARLMRERKLQEEQQRKLRAQEEQKRKLLEREEKKKQEEFKAKERINKAATLIQSAWRGHEVRKLELIQKLKSLEQIRSKVEEIIKRYESSIQEAKSDSEEPSLIKKHYRTILGLEEELTKQLFSLDSIITGGVEILRSTRKGIVENIQHLIKQMEPLKKRIQVKFNEIQKEEVKRRHEEEEERKKIEEQKKAQMEIEDKEEVQNAEMDIEKPQEEKKESKSFEIPIRFIDEQKEMETEPKAYSQAMGTKTKDESFDIEALKNEIKRLNQLLSQKDDHIKSLEEELSYLKSKY